MSGEDRSLTVWLVLHHWPPVDKAPHARVSVLPEAHRRIDDAERAALAYERAAEPGHRYTTAGLALSRDAWPIVEGSRRRGK